MIRWNSDSARSGLRVGAGLLVTALALAAAACGGSSHSAVAGAQKTLGAPASGKVIYNLQPVIFPYVTAQNAGINPEAKTLGYKVVYANANGSLTTAVSQIHDAVIAHADGIVINPLSSTALVPAIKQAIKAGVCVVSMTDNFGPRTGVVYPPGAKGYVGWNEFYDGQKAGEWIAKKIGYKGNVAVELGDVAHGASVGRYQGAKSVWKKYPGIHVVSLQAYAFNLDTIRSQVLALTTKYGSSLKGMLIDTNPGSVVAMRAINTTMQRNGVAIASVGGEKQMLDLIKQGYPAGDVPEVPAAEGVEAVKLVDDCVHGNKKPVDFLEQNLPGVSVLKKAGYVIDKSNVDVFKPDW